MAEQSTKQIQSSFCIGKELGLMVLLGLKKSKFHLKNCLIMPHIYVKDSEGFVFKKKESEVTTGEKIISEKDYMKKSGLALYEKKFGHGGAR